MAIAVPSIACLGVIGRNVRPPHLPLSPRATANPRGRGQNNPLHMSVFASGTAEGAEGTAAAPVRTALQFSMLLSSTIDIFELRARHKAATGAGATGDASLLHAVDDRLAAYGFETNTGVRMVCVVDMRGRYVHGTAAAARSAAAAAGLRDAELKPVFRAMQNAYVRLLQNPFFDPDEHVPPGGRGGRSITSKRFADEMRRIGEVWTPGVTSL